MFDRGQRVLCIREDWLLYRNGAPADPQPPADRSTPKRGSVYEVHDIGVFRVAGVGRFGIQIAMFGDEWWCQQSFVPLKQTKTDISVFTEILKRAPVPGRPVKV